MQNPPPNQQYPPPNQQQGYGTPPNQQGYGYNNPYGAPPNAQMQNSPVGGGGPHDKSSLGIEANIAATLSYVIGIVAIIMIIIEKQNGFARFHAMQAILFHVAATVIFVVLGIFVGILSAISSYLGIIGLFFPLLGLAYFAGLIYCAYKAYQGEMFKLPVIGDIAAKFVNK